MSRAQPVGVIARYEEFLPVGPDTPRVTIGEGGTPLIRAPALERRTGVSEVWLQLEGANPTGSFKDRGMAVAVAKALEAGASTLICASTGNTSASASAFGARAGCQVVVIVPKDTIALGKLAQSLVFGARVMAIRGSFDQGLDAVRTLARRAGTAVVNSINPHRLEGQKTAAFEIVDRLGDAPDEVFIPVGNAGNISAYWRGFTDYRKAGRASRTPVLRGFQATGAAPIVRGQPVPSPTTVASAIRIGNPANWREAERARDASQGTIQAVSDQAIIEAYRMLAAETGVFAELASAASVAGLLQRSREGVRPHGRVVCVLTGSGLKDPGAAIRYADDPIETQPDAAAIAAALDWEL